MSIFRRLSEGASRATGMMDRLGIDQSKLLGHDPVQAGGELRRRAFGCNACKGSTECGHLLAQNDRLSEAPDYCPNKQELDAFAQPKA